MGSESIKGSTVSIKEPGFLKINLLISIIKFRLSIIKRIMVVRGQPEIPHYRLERRNEAPKRLIEQKTIVKIKNPAIKRPIPAIKTPKHGPYKRKAGK
jgi:hypothetical protein